MGRLSPLLLLLAACAPLEASLPTLPYPGGFARGGLVEGRFQAILPGPPLFLDAGEDTLYAAYPYQLLVLKGGVLESLPLPGVPRFLRARPRPVVGLDGAVWAEGNLLPYPAQDAVLGEEGLFWVGKEGLYRERTLLQRGSYGQVVAWEGVVALGKEAFFYPEGKTLPLPAPALKAQAGVCGVVALLGKAVYLVRQEGAKPLAEAQDFAAFGEWVYLVPGERVLSCREVVWP
ncbi:MULTISPECIES: hypothetical protein [Thermus]|jgi:hypothetical protein|uniref:Lipoprotein n=1 Tax=Thermus brockianus TaxID=56956 RepID=A0A1J0LXE8_THEBO|nr:hypothetical protein [Thermus brockianus]APD10157.1 hypothetical protein A0O31_02101 [Thermus brockianus]BDG16518.1 hypothetical protein TbrSNM41_12520 [Thermus brockianus]